MKLFGRKKKLKNDDDIPNNTNNMNLENIDSAADFVGYTSPSRKKKNLYQYAIHEYSNTVDPQCVDENGWEIQGSGSSGGGYGATDSFGIRKRNTEQQQQQQFTPSQEVIDENTELPMAVSSPRRKTMEVTNTTTTTTENSNNNNNEPMMMDHQQNDEGGNDVDHNKQSFENDQYHAPSYERKRSKEAPYVHHSFSEDANISNISITPGVGSASSSYESHSQARNYANNPEPEMPDATYEENYGDAYVNAPIRYIYPSGYQNMRPRSGPWKISLIVCMLFTWLTVFIVGHCSDKAEKTYYNVVIDDDLLVIETRWCGSRLLYFMWLMSIIITGLATAYCSIIGYIQARDFAVANCRSQPPGMVGKSDYYVRIEDGPIPPTPPSPLHGHSSYNPPTYQSGRSFQKSIYQADGTPQFWGSHIYRPTQAAVAVTSR